MTLELEIDVPENRQVTLPDSVPVGKVKVTVQTAFDPLAPLPGASEKLERERAAFYRLLPELLKTHRGKVAVIYDEKVLLTGDDAVQVGLEAYKQVGYVTLYVQRVEERRPVERLRGPRELQREA